MLSLVGSLHSDPFDPSHVPSTSVTQAEDEEDLDEIAQELQPDSEQEEDELYPEDALEEQPRVPSPPALKKSSKRKIQDKEHSAPKAKKQKGDEDTGKKKRKKA